MLTPPISRPPLARPGGPSRASWRVPLLAPLLVTALALAGLLHGTAARAQDVVLDSIEAVVGDGVVLASDVRAEADFLRRQNVAEGKPVPSDDVLRARVVEKLIDDEVLRQHAKRIGISVDAQTVNRAVERVASTNNMDLQQFRETLRAEGFDYEQYRASIRQELLRQRLVQREVESSIDVSEQEIDDFVDALESDVAEQTRYRVAHILVGIPPSAPEAERDAARAKAQSILGRLRGGEDFATVAAGESDGAGALDGGDLGYRTLQELPDFLADAVRNLSVGELAGPLTSPNGLHLIELLDTRSSDPRTRAETLARHVFIAGDGSEVRRRIEDVRARIASGEDFADVAAALSEDPNSSDEGGELPWFAEGEMPEELERVAGDLPAGRISEPFRTRFGWHVLEVLDRRTSDVQQQEVRQRAEAAISARRVEQEAERWMRRLRDESFVDLRT